MNRKFKLVITICIVVQIILAISCSQNITENSQSDLAFLPTPTPALVSTNTSQIEQKNSNENISEGKFYLASDTCKKLRNKEDQLLCETMVDVNNLDEDATQKEFSYLSNRLDLNNDGNNDAVIWINDRCGTSGCPILIFQKTNTGFQRILDEFAWTPIIRLESETNGWNDISIQIAGGGVEPHFQVLSFDGKEYKFKNRQNEQPKGKVILDKNWKRSVFGSTQTK